MKLYGITRFNIVTNKTIDSFRLTKGKTLAEAKKITFDPNSLDYRIKSFEAFCLPTYDMLISNDNDVNGIILINDDLPESYKNRIYSLCSGHDNLSIIEIKENESVSEVTTPFIQKFCKDERVFTFRYDDDDALPMNYSKLIKSISSTLSNGTVISLNKGIAVSKLTKDEIMVRERMYKLNAFGLGVVSNIENFKNIFELGAHTKIELPCYHDKESIGWLSTIHQSNDSRVGEPLGNTYNFEEVLKMINQSFPQISQNALSILTLRKSSGV